MRRDARFSRAGAHRLGGGPVTAGVGRSPSRSLGGVDPLGAVAGRALACQLDGGGRVGGALGHGPVGRADETPVHCPVDELEQRLEEAVDIEEDNPGLCRPPRPPPGRLGRRRGWSRRTADPPTRFQLAGCDHDPSRLSAGASALTEPSTRASQSTSKAVTASGCSTVTK